MNTVGVNHVPSQPSKRRDGGSARTDVLPRTKRHKPCAAASPPVVPPVLDPPSSAHTRVAQRQKMIAKGKNTAGYDAYRRQVPVEQRRPRSMDTPSTPDVHRDVPNKRWQGLVRAWRVALHKYDPQDLVTSLEPSVTTTGGLARPVSGGCNETEATHAQSTGLWTPTKAQQLERDVATGVVVDLPPEWQGTTVSQGSPLSIYSNDSNPGRELSFDEPKLQWGDEDSDDDFL